MRLVNDVAIITGAASGIGLESALLFAREGCKVVMADINEDAGLKSKERVEKALKSPHSGSPYYGKNVTGQVEFKKCDVSNEQQVKELVDFTVAKFGKLTVMFNNAGIMHPQDDLPDTTSQQVWDLTFNINVKGVFYGCKYAVEQMRQSGGSIINTGSFVGLVGAATAQIAYTASKGAVLAMTRELAVAYAKDNIRVNALCPGPLNTPLLQSFLNTPEKQNRRLTHIPSGRFGEPIEQAYAALFLASKESSFVNGTDFLVDGGLRAAYVTQDGPTSNSSPWGKSEVQLQ